MKAEAAFWANGATAAEPYINELRDRVGMPHVSGITFEQLQNEIRIETCFEGLRYYDMKRWRILSKMNGKPHDFSASQVTLSSIPLTSTGPFLTKRSVRQRISLVQSSLH